MKKALQVLALIATFLVLGTLYYFNKNLNPQSSLSESERTDMDSAEPRMGGELGEYEYIEKDSTDEDPAKIRVEPLNDWVSSVSPTYTNSELGFQLTFPDSWYGYQSREIKYKINFNNGWTDFNETLIYFDIPNSKNNRLFAIRAVTKEEWDSIPKDARECTGRHVPCIGPSFAESSDYVFSYFFLGSLSSPLGVLDEVVSIIKTFKLLGKFN